MTTKIELYTTAYCPYCMRAKALLQRKGVEFQEIDLTNDDAGRDALIQRTNGKRSIPQIFIDGQHIGGSDDLYALDRAGKLDPLLAS